MTKPPLRVTASAQGNDSSPRIVLGSPPQQCSSPASSPGFKSSASLIGSPPRKITDFFPKSDSKNPFTITPPPAFSPSFGESQSVLGVKDSIPEVIVSEKVSQLHFGSPKPVSKGNPVFPSILVAGVSLPPTKPSSLLVSHKPIIGESPSKSKVMASEDLVAKPFEMSPASLPPVLPPLKGA